MRARLCLTPVSLFGAGCGGDRLAGATERARAVLGARRANDIDRAVTAYGQAFYTQVSRDAWRPKLIETERATGQIEVYELAAWSSHYGVGWGPYRPGRAAEIPRPLCTARRRRGLRDLSAAVHRRCPRAHIVVTPSVRAAHQVGEVNTTRPLRVIDSIDEEFRRS
jgi:hypothetical protein